MKILIFLSLLLISILDAKCYKVPCQPIIFLNKTQAIADIERSYARNMQAQQRLEQKYIEYNAALAEQNELLEKIQKLKSDGLMSEKKINFLLQKGISIRENNIQKTNNADFLGEK